MGERRLHGDFCAFSEFHLLEWRESSSSEALIQCFSHTIHLIGGLLAHRSRCCLSSSSHWSRILWWSRTNAEEVLSLVHKSLRLSFLCGLLEHHWSRGWLHPKGLGRCSSPSKPCTLFLYPPSQGSKSRERIKLCIVLGVFSDGNRNDDWFCFSLYFRLQSLHCHQTRLRAQHSVVGGHFRHLLWVLLLRSLHLIQSQASTQLEQLLSFRHNHCLSQVQLELHFLPVLRLRSFYHEGSLLLPLFAQNRTHHERLSVEHIGERRGPLQQQSLLSSSEASLQASESRLHCSRERGYDLSIHVGFSVLDELVGSLPCDGGLLHEMATRSTPNPEGVASSSLRVLSHQVDDCVRWAYCSVS